MPNGRAWNLHNAQEKIKFILIISFIYNCRCPKMLGCEYAARWINKRNAHDCCHFEKFVTNLSRREITKLLLLQLINIITRRVDAFFVLSSKTHTNGDVNFVTERGRDFFFFRRNRLCQSTDDTNRKLRWEHRPTFRSDDVVRSSDHLGSLHFTPHDFFTKSPINSHPQYITAGVAILD